MELEIGKVLGLLFGPMGGLFALGVAFGVKISWKIFDSRSDKRYQDNLKVLRQSSEEVKKYLSLEVEQLRGELKAQEAICKKDLQALQDRIYKLIDK
jgi:esterase/lipase